jgi:poly(3-hydroxybutyrate) depolymerase
VSVARRLLRVSALTLSALTYALHVPAGFRPNVGALVIALHGAGGTGPSFERSTGFSAKADQAGFAVIYPDGLFRSHRRHR